MLKFYQHGLIKTEKQRRTNDMKKSEKAMGVLIGFIYIVVQLSRQKSKLFIMN